MMTVNEVSRLTGVSIRTLQYYDKMGLLKPTEHTAAGYRLYDNRALEKLQQILLFRELEFSLKDIKQIMDAPGFDRQKALEQQIEVLILKKQRLENLIALACGIKKNGEKYMDFSAFDTSKIQEYKKEAKAAWGKTAEYQEYEQKTKDRNAGGYQAAMMQMMGIFAEFGEIRTGEPDSARAQQLVKKLQRCITDNYYTCSGKVLAELGRMYVEDKRFTENIDKAGGCGTAEFVYKAIECYCGE